MRLKILLNDNAESFQFAVHGELKDWREHHTTACSRFGRSTALSQIAFATLRQLRLHAFVSRNGSYLCRESAPDKIFILT